MQGVITKCRNYLEQAEEPWIQYLLLDEEKMKTPAGVQLKEKIITHPKVEELITNSLQWPHPPLQRHNDAKHPFHQMHILLDMGLRREDEVIAQISQQVMNNQADEGAFLSLTLIPTHFGGTGEESFGWMQCDAPLLLHFLLRAGYREDPRVQRAIQHLTEMVDDNGWRCKSSIPKFNGPGSKKDFCPFANLIALKVFSGLQEYHDEAFIHHAIDSIFWHWEHSAERKIYLFAMGTHFRRLKYPLIWYDIVNVCHTLSHFEYACQHQGFSEMIETIVEQQEPSGGFIPESVFMNFKGWSFGQKKVESPLLTWKILEMVQNFLQQST